jgi:hypothetical protein
MERQVFLGELMILKLSKVEDGSRDDMEVVRGEVRRLNNFQTTLQRHLHDLDRILQQHDGLLFSHDPLVREQYRELKAQLRRDAETMRDLDRVAQGSLHTTAPYHRQDAREAGIKLIDSMYVVVLEHNGIPQGKH